MHCSHVNARTLTDDDDVLDGVWVWRDEQPRRVSGCIYRRSYTVTQLRMRRLMVQEYVMLKVFRLQNWTKQLSVGISDESLEEEAQLQQAVVSTTMAEERLMVLASVRMDLALAAVETGLAGVLESLCIR